MKNILKSIFAFLTMALVFVACKKEENQVTYKGGTAPVLTANRTTIPLTFANKDNEGVVFSWTNPNYSFNTGISSHNVSYNLEIDSAGKNFASNKKQTVSIASDLMLNLTQGQLNDYLLNQLQFPASVASTIEVRVVASINGLEQTKLASNTLRYTITPYAIPPKVAPPTTGKLYLVGDATVGGWSNPVPVPTQQFTQVTSTLYEITVPFNNGGDKAYLMLPLNGDWGAKFGNSGSNKSNDPFSYDLKNGGGDVLAPAAAGTYKISVDFQRGKVTVTKI